MYKKKVRTDSKRTRLTKRSFLSLTHTKRYNPDFVELGKAQTINPFFFFKNSQ